VLTVPQHGYIGGLGTALRPQREASCHFSCQLSVVSAQSSGLGGAAFGRAKFIRVRSETDDCRLTLHVAGGKARVQIVSMVGPHAEGPSEA
jgi:hypothetical protein